MLGRKGKSYRRTKDQKKKDQRTGGQLGSHKNQREKKEKKGIEEKVRRSSVPESFVVRDAKSGGGGWSTNSG